MRRTGRRWDFNLLLWAIARKCNLFVWLQHSCLPLLLRIWKFVFRGVKPTSITLLQTMLILVLVILTLSMIFMLGTQGYLHISSLTPSQASGDRHQVYVNWRIEESGLWAYGAGWAACGYLISLSVSLCVSVWVSVCECVWVCVCVCMRVRACIGVRVIWYLVSLIVFFRRNR